MQELLYNSLFKDSHQSFRPQITVIRHKFSILACEFCGAKMKCYRKLHTVIIDLREGRTVGFRDGFFVGLEVGLRVGFAVGLDVGLLVGLVVGVCVG